MKYNNSKQGIFLERPNRFIARVLIEGREEICHVKNTGRCKELLTKGATVFLEAAAPGSARKTAFSLVGVKKGERMINMDSQAPNKVVSQWILEGGLGFLPSYVKPEKTFLHSRFDFYIEREGQGRFIETKGVTLEKNNIAFFPDAPTERGLKHVEELILCKEQGYEAQLIFVVQMEGCLYFTPNDETQPELKKALRRARKAGVLLQALECRVLEDGLIIQKEIPVILE